PAEAETKAEAKVEAPAEAETKSEAPAEKDPAETDEKAEGAAK
ncbi:MAG: ribonuclease III, partial [Candidatus Thioglobus sp.]